MVYSIYRKSVRGPHFGNHWVVWTRNRQYTSNSIEGVQRGFLHWMTNKFNLLGRDIRLRKLFVFLRS